MRECYDIKIAIKMIVLSTQFYMRHLQQIEANIINTNEYNAHYN